MTKEIALYIVFAVIMVLYLGLGLIIWLNGLGKKKELNKKKKILQ